MCGPCGNSNELSILQRSVWASALTGIWLLEYSEVLCAYDTEVKRPIYILYLFQQLCKYQRTPRGLLNVSCQQHWNGSLRCSFWPVKHNNSAKEGVAGPLKFNICLLIASQTWVEMNGNKSQSYSVLDAASGPTRRRRCRRRLPRRQPGQLGFVDYQVTSLTPEVTEMKRIAARQSRH